MQNQEPIDAERKLNKSLVDQNKITLGDIKSLDVSCGSRFRQIIRSQALVICSRELNATEYE